MYSIHDLECLTDSLLVLGAEGKWLTAYDVAGLALAAPLVPRRQRSSANALRGLLRRVAPQGQLSVDCERLERWLERHKGLEVEGFVVAKCADVLPRWRLVRIQDSPQTDPLPWEESEAGVSQMH
jgi:hypothetical protein